MGHEAKIPNSYRTKENIAKVFQIPIAN